MRHRRAKRKLSRNTSNRKALMRSLVASLMLYERISTTHEKAKEASSAADKVITLGKRNTITAKKTAIEILGSKVLINKIFDDIAPRFADRAGGYTRVLQLMPRKGDGAKMAILELTERKIIEKPAAKKAEKKVKEAPAKQKSAKGGPVPGEKPAKEEKAHAPAPPKAPPTSQKEKDEEGKSKEKAKSEKGKLKKGFFKGLRRYFRGKSN